MSWIVTIRATYESSDEAKRVLDLLLGSTNVRIVPPGSVEVGWAAFVELRRKRRDLIAIYDFGERSKYAAARPTLTALGELFDPIADDQFYQPWPLRVHVVSAWKTS